MPRTPINRTLAAGAAVLTLGATFALAGCGGDDEPESKASSSPSATVSESGAAAPSVDAAVSDVVANAMENGKTAHVTMTMAGQLEAEGDLDLRQDAPALDVTMTMQGQQIHMIVVDGVVYMKMPSTGGKYVKVDTAAGGAMAGFDPSEMLDELRKVKGGEDLGDGHYRYRLDGATADLYIGDDDLIERVVVDTGAGTMEMTYSDWGKDVHIEPPAPKDTTTMPDGQSLG